MIIVTPKSKIFLVQREIKTLLNLPLVKFIVDCTHNHTTTSTIIAIFIF